MRKSRRIILSIATEFMGTLWTLTSDVQEPIRFVQFIHSEINRCLIMLVTLKS